MKYKGAPSKLVNKTRQQDELEKYEVKMLVQSDKKLHTFIANILSSYA